MKKSPNLYLIRDGFYVTRYHTGPMIKPETVGHHTANVVALIYHLYDQEPPHEVVRAALHHDVPEVATGDVPAPIKWKNKELNDALEAAEKRISEEHGLVHMADLSEKDRDMLSFADTADLVFKCIEEFSLGSVVVTKMIERGWNALIKKAQKIGPHSRVAEVMDMIHRNPYVDIEAVCAEPVQVVVMNPKAETEKENIH